MYLDIAKGARRDSRSWRLYKESWLEFCESLSEPLRTPETRVVYAALGKAEKDELKQVAGGFVAGRLKMDGGPRSRSNIESRSMITIDLDHLPSDGLDSLQRKLSDSGLTSCWYTTRSHFPGKPRARVIFPLSESCTVDQYEPIARYLASTVLDIGWCDRTTYDVTRLMYYPSCSADSEYIFRSLNGSVVVPQDVLAQYEDWRDISQWPMAETEIQKNRMSGGQQEDPLTKAGIIGHFCRAYTISEAIEEFLQGVYTEGSVPCRLTYAGGSTSNGAIIYEEKYLYSHHDTDPCGGQLVNAFDLVRIHLFRAEDDGLKPDTPTNKRPSFKAMTEYALNDSRVRRMAMDAAFAAPVAVEPEETEDDESWRSQLDLTQSGDVKNTLRNAVTIMQCWPMLKGVVALDTFTGKIVLGRPPAWETDLKKRRAWTDTDSAYLYSIMEHVGITSTEKVDHAVTITANENQFNEVLDYFNSLQWDGVQRVDTLLIDYFGAEDTELNRWVSRLPLIAVYARNASDGVKFDNMPILTGAQGIGKSTFLRTLAVRDEWFTDSIGSFEGKEPAEQLVGKLIVEIAELQAFRRSESTACKMFISKISDDYRPAYARHSVQRFRRCAIFGSTNDNDYLKDQTGNRRYWPVECGVNAPTKNVFDDLRGEVDQIWAEAVELYRRDVMLYGEPVLHLPEHLAKEAAEIQERHRDESPWVGPIGEFLDRRIPDDYWSSDLESMRIKSEGRLPEGSGVIRDRVSIQEIWCFALGGDLKRLDRKLGSEIRRCIRSIGGWEDKQLRFGAFGKSRGFIRKD